MVSVRLSSNHVELDWKTHTVSRCSHCKLLNIHLYDSIKGQRLTILCLFVIGSLRVSLQILMIKINKYCSCMPANHPCARVCDACGFWAGNGVRAGLHFIIIYFSIQ